MNALQVTRENVATCKRARQALRAHLDRLTAMTKRYPVECTFAGYRRVFRSRQDILNAIAELDRSIEAFDAAA